VYPPWNGQLIIFGARPSDEQTRYGERRRWEAAFQRGEIRRYGGSENLHFIQLNYVILLHGG